MSMLDKLNKATDPAPLTQAPTPAPAPVPAQTPGEIEADKIEARIARLPPTAVYMMKGSSYADVAGKQSEILMEHSASLHRLTTEFALHFDEATLRSPESFFTDSNDFPYAFMLVGTGVDTHSVNSRSSLIARGHRPVNVTEDRFRDTYVTGRDALLLGLPRNAAYLSEMARRKIPLPPALPERLRGKWGTLMPITVNSDGHVMVGTRLLYYIERELLKERLSRLHLLSGGNPNMTPANFLTSPDAIGGVEQGFDVPISAAPNQMI